MSDSTTTDHLPAFIAKMQREGLPPVVADTFAYYYRQLCAGETGLIHDRDILPVKSEETEDATQLNRYEAAGRQAVKQTIRIVLNGGLGTTMGLIGPKSLIEAKNGHSFLSIILRQSESSLVQMALMNSYSTHAETLAALDRLKPTHKPLTFLQHKFPKVLQKDYSPAHWSTNPELEWNPPGHGDVFTALLTSGMLQKLLDEDIQYAFISNSDNLGARLDVSLLGYFAENRFPFMMEVAAKTPADLKGGHLARHKNGRLILRESAQCPKEELKAFEDIRRYRYFNTNNVWLNVTSLRDLFKREKTIRLPIILNPKNLDPRDTSSPPVYQIETAMGAAISMFPGATAVRVPRSRFFPVKTCNDLLALRSDVFVYTKDHDLIINPIRKASGSAGPIKINLDPKFFAKIDDLDQRVGEQIPSLVSCDSLIIEGDVRFEKNVIIKGSITIRNSRCSQAVIREGTILDRDVII